MGVGWKGEDIRDISNNVNNKKKLKNDIGIGLFLLL